MGFSGRRHFDPVPTIVRGCVVDHHNKTCAQVHAEIMERFKEGFVRVSVLHKDRSLETFETFPERKKK